MFKLLYVYILKCADNSYYIGVTNDLNRRLDEHNMGTKREAYTFKRRPVSLVYWQEFFDYQQAFDWETQLKGWTRKKKEALIEENWDRIKELAECKNRSSHKLYKKE